MASQIERSLLTAGILTCLLLPNRLAAQVSTPDTVRSMLLQQARSGNLELMALRAAVRSAASRVEAVRARGAPVLSAEVEEIPGGAEVWNAGQAQLAIEQELFSGGRRSAAAGVAAVELRRHQLALELRERTLGARLDRELARWRGHLGIDQRLALEDGLLRDIEEGLAARFAAGQARYVDVLRVRTERLRVQSDRADAMAEAGEARLRLLLLAGADSIPPVGDSLTPLSSSLPAPVAIDSLFETLAATGAFTLDRDLADAELARARADRAVRISGGIGIQRFGAPGDFTVGPTLRASASLPFAVARSNAALREAGSLAASESSARTLAQRAQLRSAMRQLADRYAAARNRAHLFDTGLLRGSRAEREAALTAYRTGELTLIELLDFERALARAETDQIRAVMQARTAYADLFDLLRGTHE